VRYLIQSHSSMHLPIEYPSLQWLSGGAHQHAEDGTAGERNCG
jgi:hypothetical protein